MGVFNTGGAAGVAVTRGNGCYDTFQMDGKWWALGDPERRIRGTLRYSEGEACLSAAGDAGDGTDADLAGSETICGKAATGEDVILCGCVPYRDSLRESESVRRVCAQWALVGSGIRWPAEFSSARVSLTYLDEWIGAPARPGGAPPDPWGHAQGGTDSFRARDGLEVTVDPGRGVQLELVVAGMAVSQASGVEFRARDPMGLDALRECVEDFRGLLSLATSWPCLVLQITAQAAQRGPDPGRGAEGSVHVYGMAPAAHIGVDHRRVPLPYVKIRENLGGYYLRWTERGGDMQYIRRRYSDFMYGRPVAAMDPMASLMMAADGCSGDSSPDGGGFEAWLGAMLAEFPVAMARLDPAGIVDPAARVRRHAYGLGALAPGMQDSERDMVRSTVLVLVEAHMLRLMGIGPAQIEDFIRARRAQIHSA